MIQKPPSRTTTDRRILSLPAVRPCEGISPPTLLSSLLSLAREICNTQPNDAAFASQRRNAREAIRQVNLLLVFFEEIHGGYSPAVALPDAALLCLAELHVALQKLRFLLLDLARDGARVWVLTKCLFVASQFRALSGAVATALEVLPLSSIGVGAEVREVVELVAAQSRRARFEVDRGDERLADQVFGILSRLERKIEPELSSLKRVLDRLGIRSWSDCDKEVRFLEEEIELESLDCGEREVPLLSGLLGLMSFSRSAVFDEIDRRSTEERADSPRCSTSEAVVCLNPMDFRCPISLGLMTDPVTVSTGQTYDRSSIEKWLKGGNMTCPKTGEKLANAELVPNVALRRLIRNFCEDNGVSMEKSGRRSRDGARRVSPGSPAAAEAMKFLSALLVRRLVFGANAEKNKAAYEIRLLAKSSGFNRSCLVDEGAVLPLLNLLSSAAAASDKSTQENAAAAILKLAKHGSGRILIVESGGLAPILDVLANGLSAEAKQIAAATVFYLASSQDHRRLIGESPQAVPALAELVRTGTTCGKKNAVVAIFALLFFPNNVPRVLQAGTVPLLVNALTFSDKTELITDTLAVLATLAENPDGAGEIARQGSALSAIKAILQSSSSRAAKEYCVSTFLSLCNSVGARVVASLAGDQSLMGLLYSVTTEGTCLASKKARCLIKILHKFRETTTSSGLVGLSSHEQQSSVRAW